MPYEKTDWKDTVKDDKGNILQKGTPLNASNMNKIENQLEKVTQETDKLTDYQLLEEKGKPNGYASLGPEGIIPSSQLPSILKEMKVVENITERDSLEKFEGLRVLVIDATGDETVKEGWAEYVWTGTEFIKTAEAESLDLVLSWDNILDKPDEFKPTAHTHTESEIIDLDKYSKEEINTFLESKSNIDHTHPQLHTHDNKATLDKITETTLSNIDDNADKIADLENKSHSHNNKSTLDKIIYSGNETEIDLARIKELETRQISYSDLENKPTIPTKTSELNNDSNFVKSTNIGGIKITVSDVNNPPVNPSPNDIWIII